MKIKDLLEKLAKYDSNLEIILYSETPTSIVPFEVISISEGDAERKRLDSGKPSINFGNSPTASKFVFIEISDDI